MNPHAEPIDSNSLRIRLEGKYEYRKDIINRSRELWETSNKSKAVMRSADAFVDVDLLERELGAHADHPPNGPLIINER